MRPGLLAVVALLVWGSVAAAGELDGLLDDISPEVRKWATVVSVQDQDGAPRFQWHHYRDSAESVEFWPASVIKVYAVVAALELVNELGADMDSVLAFERQTDGVWVQECARTMREMISEVFRRSSNEDYTLLLRFVGIDRMNAQWLTPERGFPHSALMRGYVRGRPYEYVREEPQRITIHTKDARRLTVEHHWSGTSYSEQRGATVISAATGNCSSTREMAECLRRIMFHEQLGESERYRLTEEQLRFVREGGAGLFGLENREAGPYAWTGAADSVFPDARYFHKAGLISNYSLDLAYIDDEATGVRYILSAAANTGDAATVTAMARRIALWMRDRRCRDGREAPLPPAVEPGAQLVEVYADDRFFEGPVWDRANNRLLFTAFGKDNQQILRLESPGQTHVWLDHTEGINGMYLGGDGRLLGAQAYGHRVLSMAIGVDGPAEQNVLATDSSWHQPNDVCQSPAGHIYFTDPDFRNRTASAVYWLSPSGEVTKIIDDMAVPNGLITSNDSQSLYVADSHRKHWRRYVLQPDGSAGAGDVFFDPATPDTSDPDGMTIDSNGILYFAGRGGVWSVAPTGHCLGKIPVPEFCSNLTFGGPDGRTLYLTCKGKVYRLAMRTKGVGFGKDH